MVCVTFVLLLWIVQFSQIITVSLLRVNEIVWYVKCRAREKGRLPLNLSNWYCYCTFFIYYMCKIIWLCVISLMQILFWIKEYFNAFCDYFFLHMNDCCLHDGIMSCMYMHGESVCRMQCNLCLLFFYHYLGFFKPSFIKFSNSYLL